QAGRAGRKSGKSLAVLIGRSTPLDQYIMNNPEFFFANSPENARINPENLYILVSHIKCAAFELPFVEGEKFGKEDLQEILKYLEENGILHRTGGKWHWTQDSYPANDVPLRSISSDNFVVVDKSDGNRILAYVDYSAAPTTIHDEAIYLCEGKQYYVEKLDFQHRKAYVKEENTDYFTDAMDYTKIRILDEFDSKNSRNCMVEHGEVHVTNKVVGYKKIKFGTNENIGYGKIHLPENELHTTSYWFTLEPSALDTISFNRSEIVDGLVGTSYLLLNIASVLLMCDTRDIHRAIGDKSAKWFAAQSQNGIGIYTFAEDPNEISINSIDRFEPTIFIYDNYPGGIGFSEVLFDQHDFLVNQALQRINNCSCQLGCPSCVGPINEVGAGTKEVAIAILEKILDKSSIILN
ncbi:MAG: DUF1998 domain-containing protein, partial [Acidobacteria bacterium]|nr:DUF1998 domain-containing protein [Acidobacteriota bacterium]